MTEELDRMPDFDPREAVVYVGQEKLHNAVARYYRALVVQAAKNAVDDEDPLTFVEIMVDGVLKLFILEQVISDYRRTLAVMARHADTYLLFDDTTRLRELTAQQTVWTLRGELSEKVEVRITTGPGGKYDLGVIKLPAA